MPRVVIIVGGGPAGLAVAATLARRGQRAQVIEQGTEVGSSWRQRWDGLRLHTMRALSGLPGAPVPRRCGRWVTKDDYADYLRHYAEHFDVDLELGTRATRVDRAGSGWAVTTVPAGEAHRAVTQSGTEIELPHGRGPADGAGEVSTRSADAVVIATGYSRVPFIPDWAGRELYSRSIIHTSDYRNPLPYAGRQVLVVGVGNSAAEIATELVDGGATVRLAVRTPPNIVRRSSLGVPSQLVGLSMKRAPEWVMDPASALLRRITVPDLTDHGLPPPAGGFTQFLRTRTVPVLDHGFVDHVRAGRITVVAAVDHLSRDAVHLVDGTAVEADTVICGTGFRPALEPLVGHLGVLDRRGLPLVHGSETVPDAPGLHFVGITVELSGLLHEIGSEARAVGLALSRPTRDV